MKKSLIYILSSLALAGSIASCSSDDEGARSKYVAAPVTTPELTLTASETDANEAVNKFSYDFAVKTLTDDYYKEQNVNPAVSPVSAMVCLGVMANSFDDEASKKICEMVGVKNQADLNSLITKLMRFLPDKSNGAVTELANSVWYAERYEVKEEYVANMNRTFYSDVTAADLSSERAMNEIDGWVNEKTHGLIPEISEMLNPSSDLVTVLLNATYFSGAWMNKFDKAKTHARTFDATTGEVGCEMMYQEMRRIRYGADELAQTVVLPFAGSCSMILMLPYENGSVDGLLTSLDYESWMSGLNNLALSNVNISLPKFETEVTLTRLDKVFKSMGCDIDNLSLVKMGIGERSEFNVFQKNAISVDEEGAKLASVTGNTGDTMAPSGESVNVDFNRPFVYFVRNNLSGTILMAGRVERP